MCLTIGRLENIKGYRLLLSALCQWKDTPLWPKLFFAWLGSGSLESSLRSSLEEMGLADHVLMPGRRWDVPDWLDAADVFLLPSYCEGMPISIMEAMAKGLPVMATAVSGTPEELVRDGQIAVLAQRQFSSDYYRDGCHARALGRFWRVAGRCRRRLPPQGVVAFP